MLVCDTARFQEASNTSRYESQKSSHVFKDVNSIDVNFFDFYQHGTFGETRFKNSSLYKASTRKIWRCNNWRLQSFGNPEEAKKQCIKKEDESGKCSREWINMN